MNVKTTARTLRRRRVLRLWALMIGVVALTAGCIDDFPSGLGSQDVGTTQADLGQDAQADAHTPGDASATQDAEADAEADASAMQDAEADAEVDAEIDAEVDAETDAEVDAETDAEVDAETDAEVDAETDAEVDAETDAEVDAETDAQVDAETDAEVDAETDAEVDAETDAEVDAETDAQVPGPYDALCGEWSLCDCAIKQVLHCTSEEADLCPGAHQADLQGLVSALCRAQGGTEGILDARLAHPDNCGAFFAQVLAFDEALAQLCTEDDLDAGVEPDAALPDAALPDAALPDAALPDAALPDAALPDAALPDAALPDAEVDAEVDAALDAGPYDEICGERPLCECAVPLVVQCFLDEQDLCPALNSEQATSVAEALLWQRCAVSDVALDILGAYAQHPESCADFFGQLAQIDEEFELTCQGPPADAGLEPDAGAPDAEVDAEVDAGAPDAEVDAGAPDAEVDAGVPDAELDADVPGPYDALCDERPLCECAQGLVGLCFWEDHSLCPALETEFEALGALALLGQRCAALGAGPIILDAYLAQSGHCGDFFAQLAQIDEEFELVCKGPSLDAGLEPDAGAPDAGPEPDAGLDAGLPDAEPDAEPADPCETMEDEAQQCACALGVLYTCYNADQTLCPGIDPSADGVEAAQQALEDLCDGAFAHRVLQARQDAPDSCESFFALLAEISPGFERICMGGCPAGTVQVEGTRLCMYLSEAPKTMQGNPCEPLPAGFEPGLNLSPASLSDHARREAAHAVLSASAGLSQQIWLGLRSSFLLNPDGSLLQWSWSNGVPFSGSDPMWKPALIQPTPTAGAPCGMMEPALFIDGKPSLSGRSCDLSLPPLCEFEY